MFGNVYHPIWLLYIPFKILNPGIFGLKKINHLVVNERTNTTKGLLVQQNELKRSVFGLFVLCHIKLLGLFNAKDIPVKE